MLRSVCEAAGWAEPSSEDIDCIDSSIRQLVTLFRVPLYPLKARITVLFLPICSASIFGILRR